MKNLTPALVILATVTLAGGPAHARNIGPGCTTKPGSGEPTPVWDQQYATGTSRFICLSDWGGDAVLDQETGLVWERTPGFADVSTANWGDALYLCHALKNVNNRYGWRLPSVEELGSLIDHTQSSPALPAGNPFMGIAGNSYWTATTADGPYSPTGAYFVTFLNNGGIQPDYKTSSYHVWCVRGGSSVQNPQ